MSSTGSSRGNPSMGDIVRSVFVIGLIILGLWLFGRLLFTDDEPVSLPAVDYRTTVDQARPAASYPLLAPEALPKGWRATSARFTPTTWHLGIQSTGDEDYIGLEQVPVSVTRAVERFAEGSVEAGETTIAGETWSVRSGPKGRWTFARSDGDVTTLVNGTTSKAFLARYVASLSDGSSSASSD